MDNKGLEVEVESTSFSFEPQLSVYIDVDVVKDKQPPVYENNGSKLDKPTLGDPSFTVEPPRLTSPPPDKPYADMNKEDLLRFSETPFWQRFRLVSIVRIYYSSRW